MLLSSLSPINLLLIYVSTYVRTIYSNLISLTHRNFPIQFSHLTSLTFLNAYFPNFTANLKLPMPSNANRQFLDFEKPIKDLIDEIEKLKHAQEHKKIDYTDAISKLETQILERRNDITEHLSSWQRVQLSRHPDRPYTLKYIQNMTTNFVELFGDRNVKDDKAMVGGFASLAGQTVMMIGQQKGINTKTRQLRNFGMANPEGYRKALRLMRLAEKFDKAISTRVDAPDA